jgi:hypothetical protein
MYKIKNIGSIQIRAVTSSSDYLLSKLNVIFFGYCKKPLGYVIVSSTTTPYPSYLHIIITYVPDSQSTQNHNYNT